MRQDDITGAVQQLLALPAETKASA